MSDSSFSDSSDLDDIAEYEMIMEINNEEEDEVEAVRMRRYINRERDVLKITVLHHSSLFDDLLADNEPVALYVVNGQPFHRGYYLADGIYPQWSTFVKSFTVACDEKNVVFKRRQENAGKMLKGHLVSYKDDGVLLLNLRVLGL
ncbi:ALP1-like protein isoform X1 [Tanacetum coccineum]